MYSPHYTNERGCEKGPKHAALSARPCDLLLRATRTQHCHTSSPLFLLSPCPVTEPSVWTDCDIGCVGDRLAGVISEGEKNRSVSLYLTPSFLHPSLMNGETGWCRAADASFIFQEVAIFLPGQVQGLLVFHK